jgi:hypothetical protein
MRSIGLALILGGMGCGGPQTGSCDLRPAISGICEEFSASADVLAKFKHVCLSSSSSTWKDGPCPRTQALGGCQAVTAEETITNWYYPDSNDHTPNDVKKTCDMTKTIFITP